MHVFEPIINILEREENLQRIEVVVNLDID
jgi:hypothetical protein